MTIPFVIENSGNTAVVATDNAVVRDIFDPILAITSVTLDGVSLVEGTDYTYNQATGEFVTSEGAITVPAATYTQNPDGSFGAGKEITRQDIAVMINNLITENNTDCIIENNMLS